MFIDQDSELEIQDSWTWLDAATKTHPIIKTDLNYSNHFLKTYIQIKTAEGVNSTFSIKCFSMSLNIDCAKTGSVFYN